MKKTCYIQGIILTFIVLTGGESMIAQYNLEDTLKNNFFKMKEVFFNPEKFPEYSDRITQSEIKQFYKEYSLYSKRMDQNGTLESYITSINNYNLHNLKSKKSLPPWTFMGPVGLPVNPVNPNLDWSTGEGWINSLYIDESNPDEILIGARHGGLWKTTNNGNSWQSLTDDYEGLNSIRAIAIDPYNQDNIIVVSSKLYFKIPYSASSGLYKSTDGGQTWTFNPIQISGIDWYPTATLEKILRKVIYHPTIQNLVFIITYDHILKSMDNGSTWNLLYQGDYEWWTGENGFFDIDFDTYNQNKLYVSGSHILVSDNLGGTWDEITNDITGYDRVKRVEMDVASHSPGDVWFFVNNTSPYKQIYRYSGSFPPTLLKSGNFSVVGLYCQEIHISPITDDIIYLAGLGLYRYTHSLNQVTPLNNRGTGPTDSHWVHTDIRDLVVIEVSNKNRIYLGHDGGISWCEDDEMNHMQTWNYISDDGTDGLEITEFHGIGSSILNPDLIAGGCQDVSGFYFDGNSWYHTNYGDGGETKFSNLYPNTVYLLSPCCAGGRIYVSLDKGATIHSIYTTGSQWVYLPMVLKNNCDTLLAGAKNGSIYDIAQFSNPSNYSSPGMSWLNLPGDGNKPISAIEVSNFNNSIIYAARQQYYMWCDQVNPVDYTGALFRSENNGISWDDLSSNFLGLYAGFIDDIETNPFNPDEIWLTLGMATDDSDPQTTKKIYKSSNGGTSWIAYNNGFPTAIPVSKIIFDKEEYVLYIATDIGVYYRKLNQTEWKPYNYGLPLKIVTDIEINYTADKIRIGTLGRSIWEASRLSTYDPNKFYQSGYESWYSDATFYSDIDISGYLLIDNASIITMHPETSITVNSGGTLIVQNGSVINHANVIVKNGGTLNILSDGELILYNDDEITIESGAIFNYEYGSVNFK